MPRTPEKLYLDLLKKTLSFTLWPEPAKPLVMGNEQRSVLRRSIISLVTSLLNRKGFEIVKRSEYKEEDRVNGLVYPLYAETMIGVRRLDNIQNTIETILRENIIGDLIETGVWRGGACIFMRAVLAANGITDRRVFVADCFQGLPRPSGEYSADIGDKHYSNWFLNVDIETVKANFLKYDLLDDQVVFLKGWFCETLPKAPIERLSLLRLDGDMYQST